MSAWTKSERLTEVLRGPLGAHIPALGLQVIERPGWYQVVREDPRDLSSNEVIFSELGTHEVEREIDDTIAFYAKLGLRFKWVVGPTTKPSDMPERLRRRGFEEWEACGMCASSTLRVDTPMNTRVELVTNDSFETFVRAMAAGWSIDPGLVRNDLSIALRSDAYRLFLAWHGNQPVGTAAYVRHPRSAYFMAGVVLPEFRKLGVYRSLLAARLEHAAASGLSLVTTQARKATSVPILERLGFETVCRFRLFRSP